MEFPGLLNYWVAIFLFACGFVIIIDSKDMIKKLVGLGIFQAAVFLIFITMGKIENGVAPILNSVATQYSSPLPHVLILTAIVVGVATTSVGLALVIRIRKTYETICEDEIDDLPDIESKLIP